MPPRRSAPNPITTSHGDSGGLEATLDAEHASAAKESPYHHRVVAKDDYNDIDGERDHDFNWQDKSLVLEKAHLLNPATAPMKMIAAIQTE
jgi:hypothetical protein